MKIQILIDNPDSWFWNHAQQLCLQIHRETSFMPELVTGPELVKASDFLFILSCNNIVPENILKQADKPLVVHASDLPKGRGWSPIAWQVEQDRNKIPVCLFEASKQVDAGNIYLREWLELNGTELLPEIRTKLYAIIEEMILRTLKHRELFALGEKQEGKPTYFKKRNQKNNELNPDKTIASQFNKLRVCDNQRYLAWFTIRNQKYFVRLTKNG